MNWWTITNQKSSGRMAARVLTLIGTPRSSLHGSIMKGMLKHSGWSQFCRRIDYKSSLVQVWLSALQATSHYLKQCFQDVWRRLTSQDHHYRGVIMNIMASQIIGVSIVYSTVCSGADQRKDQSYASLAFVRGIHLSPLNSPNKGPVTRKMFPLDDVTMTMS